MGWSSGYKSLFSPSCTRCVCGRERKRARKSEKEKMFMVFPTALVLVYAGASFQFYIRAQHAASISIQCKKTGFEEIFRHFQGGWKLDQSSIFSLLDGFVQRCTHLLEVCDCQQQFSRRFDGVELPLPCFAGQQGLEITSKLQKIQSMFYRSLQKLYFKSGDIFELKCATWHDSFNRFRSEVKELQLMTQNLISSSFLRVRKVEHGVQQLNVFHHISTREAIKQTLDRQSEEVCSLFTKDLDLLKVKLGQKEGCTPAHMPHYAGQAHWVRANRNHIDSQMEVLQRFMPQTNTLLEVHEAYKQLVHPMDQWIRRLFSEWSQSLDPDNLKRLDQPLMIRCLNKTDRLDINFDKSILKMFNEIHCWELLKFEVPHFVSLICQRREDLYTLRENVLLLVKEYNSVDPAVHLPQGTRQTAHLTLDCYCSRISMVHIK